MTITSYSYPTISSSSIIVSILLILGLVQDTVAATTQVNKSKSFLTQSLQNQQALAYMISLFIGTLLIIVVIVIVCIKQQFKWWQKTVIFVIIIVDPIIKILATVYLHYKIQQNQFYYSFFWLQFFIFWLVSYLALNIMWLAYYYLAKWKDIQMDRYKQIITHHQITFILSMLFNYKLYSLTYFNIHNIQFIPSNYRYFQNKKIYSFYCVHLILEAFITVILMMCFCLSTTQLSILLAYCIYQFVFIGILITIAKVAYFQNVKKTKPKKDNMNKSMAKSMREASRYQSKLGASKINGETSQFNQSMRSSKAKQSMNGSKINQSMAGSKINQSMVGSKANGTMQDSRRYQTIAQSQKQDNTKRNENRMIKSQAFGLNPGQSAMLYSKTTKINVHSQGYGGQTMKSNLQSSRGLRMEGSMKNGMANSRNSRFYDLQGSQAKQNLKGSRSHSKNKAKSQRQLSQSCKKQRNGSSSKIPASMANSARFATKVYQGDQDDMKSLTKCLKQSKMYKQTIDNGGVSNIFGSVARNPSRDKSTQRSLRR